MTGIHVDNQVLKSLFVLLIVTLIFPTYAKGELKSDVPDVNKSEPAILVVVHRDSNIEELSATEVKLLFLGRSPSIGITPIIIDYKPSNPLRASFYKQATGKSLSHSVRIWATYAFSGRGFPPVLVSSQKEVDKLLSLNPQQHIAYIEDSMLTPSMKVVFSLSPSKRL